MEAESTARIPRADVEHYPAAAVEMADEARRIVEPAIERGFEVETKPDASLVTDIDHAVERRFRELIGRWFPDHGVIGEEYPPTHPESVFQWILDPIDGTEEFVHGVPTFGTMLALHYRGVPLVGVIDHPALAIRVHAGVGLGTYRNGQRIRLTDAPARVRPEEARGRYAVVRDFPGPDGGRLLSAVFGKPAIVDRLLALFRDGGHGSRERAR